MPDTWAPSGVSSLALHVASTTYFELTEPPATSHRRSWDADSFIPAKPA